MRYCDIYWLTKVGVTRDQRRGVFRRNRNPSRASREWGQIGITIYSIPDHLTSLVALLFTHSWNSSLSFQAPTMEIHPSQKSYLCVPTPLSILFPCASIIVITLTPLIRHLLYRSIQMLSLLIRPLAWLLSRLFRAAVDMMSPPEMRTWILWKLVLGSVMI